MSDPTYRIDVEHKPAETAWPWRARVWRLSDETVVAVKVAESQASAVELAAQAVRDHNTKQPRVSVYVDDDGRPVEGHSVKA